MFRQQVEAAFHAAQHAEGQDIDLHELQGVDVVLVPFDDLAILHRRRLDGDQVVQAVVGEDETAGVLAQVARETDKLARQVKRQPQAAIAEVEVEPLDVPGLDALAGIAPDLGGQALDDVFRQSQGLAHVAQGAAGPVADDRRAQGRVATSIGLEYPLDDDLAALMLEIDINVRRLLTLLADEALEQEVIAFRVDRGDAQHIADR